MSNLAESTFKQSERLVLGFENEQSDEVAHTSNGDCHRGRGQSSPQSVHLPVPETTPALVQIEPATDPPPLASPASEERPAVQHLAPASPSANEPIGRLPSNPILAPRLPSRPPIEKTSPQLPAATDALQWMVRSPSVHPVVRARLLAMATLLRLYAPGPKSKSWTEASELAAIGMGKPSLARDLRRWTTAYLADPKNIPSVHYRNAKLSMVDNEDVVNDLKLHLQGVGKFFSAADVVQWSAQSEVRERFGFKRPISKGTATRWLKIMDYRYQKDRKGMYQDGHERDDVVEYRKVFVELWAEFEANMILVDKNGIPTHVPAIPLRPLILVTHDESTFYANDQRTMRWQHSSETPKPFRKGEGASLMVSDFCSPDFGWLRSPDG